MYGAFKSELDLPKTAATFTYLILSQPRTGSTMISSALASSGLAGVPVEYFNAEHLNVLPDPTSLAAVHRYYKDVVSRRTTANGVFGMKLHLDQFAPLFLQGDTIIEPGVSFLKSFDRIILVSRRDKVAQAISELAALRTKQWNSQDKQMEGKQNYEFDRKDVPVILHYIRRAVIGEMFWNETCDTLALKPLRVVYEDLSKSPQAELNRVVQYLGLPIKDIAPQTVKISRDSNMEAKKSLLAEIGVKFSLPPEFVTTE